jgi:hypothetical protein
MAKRRGGVALLLGLFILAGCNWTQSAFIRTASQTGSTFTAAATTLRDAHEGRLSNGYAASSFENYRSQLEGLDQQLPQQQGAPDARTLQRLTALYHSAWRVVTQPCLASGCDWRGQVATLERAGAAFQEASGA